MANTNRNIESTTDLNTVSHGLCFLPENADPITGSARRISHAVSAMFDVDLSEQSGNVEI